MAVQVGDFIGKGDWLFADIKPHGPGYTWCRVKDSRVVKENDTDVGAFQLRKRTVTENDLHIIGLCAAVLSLPEDWHGTVMSPSMVAIASVFKGSGFNPNDVPQILHAPLSTARKRAKGLKYELLEGYNLLCVRTHYTWSEYIESED